MPSPISTAEQLARQCRATMAILPYASISGLGSLDDKVLAAIFGQTMRILNELPDMTRFELKRSHKAEMQKILSVETQREYWKLRQRASRARRRAAIRDA